MTKTEFQNLCKNKIVILDGATGTNLQKAGMPTGECPEAWILENPQILLNLQKEYVEAGTDILYAPTFTANRVKLAEYGLENNLVSMNEKLVALSKEAANHKAYVAGDLTMTGQQLYPLGDVYFEELVDVYKEQATVLVQAGVDLFVIETMMSLQETRAALLAVKEICDLPVMISMTFQEDGRTLYGTDPISAVNVLQSLGADAVGLNCSTGPEEMIMPLKQMFTYANIPVLAKPNAGLPELVDENTIYKMTPEEFADHGKRLVEAGAAIIGGCCGTTPEHIRALKKNICELKPHKVRKQKSRMLSSERKTIFIDLDGAFGIVGERINPTGKKKLQEELRSGNLSMVREMARQQELDGAVLLDVNMGMNGIDEKQMMLDSIYEITGTVDSPLCIDSSHIDIIEQALRIYPGRALINSISLEKEKIMRLLPIAKKYGAMFILLPLSDEGIPNTKEEKNEIIRKVIQEAGKAGIEKEDIIVDGLVATVGANPKAALECFETISYCKNELNVATICGLSNISFGLPERMNVNTAFLTMAIANGLTMAIANPSQELLVNAAVASDMLLNKSGSDISYINRMNARKSKTFNQEIHANQSKQFSMKVKENEVFESVVEGNKAQIISSVKISMEAGKTPDLIVKEDLIPAINKVGELFDQQIYFLPQLIASANTMKVAMEYLEPLLAISPDNEKSATIIVATVEGDIHDIGKNLVVLMLKNYGYHVIDLGKDVAATTIVNKAISSKASIIGLSALMTTTMMRMKDVVELAKGKGYTGKIIIGGAAITPSFADEIHADGYSKDAAECVKLVASLLESKK